jgi:tyrosine-protein phosphatase YwqE
MNYLYKELFFYCGDMAYDKAELEEQAIKILEDDPYIFILQDVISLLPCVSSTFYNYELEKSEPIKKLIERNKILSKSRLKKRWSDDPNPATDIALYKLAATNDEIEKLSLQKVNAEVQGKIIIDFTGDD